jgi:S1-C subfamily serine protease
VIAGNQIVTGGDIIIAFDGNRIRNTDDLSTYLEEQTLPNQTISVMIIRNGATINVSLALAARPPST